MSQFDKITHISEVQDFQRNLDYFGNFLVESRKKNNKKRVDIASELSISIKTLEKWERGEGFPNLEVTPLLMIAQAYGVDVGNLERAFQVSRNARNREVNSRNIKSSDSAIFDPTINGARVNPAVTKRFK